MTPTPEMLRAMQTGVRRLLDYPVTIEEAANIYGIIVEVQEAAGFAVVPVEATPAMARAVVDAGIITRGGAVIGTGDAHEVWEAMLRAAARG